MITTNDILARLRNGESMDTIGQSIADVLNAAQEAYVAEQEIAKAEQAALDLAQAKRALACELIELIQEYGDLVDPNAADMLDEINDEDIDAMVTTLDEMFHMMSSLMQLKKSLENAAPKQTVKVATKRPKSDDEVLSNFIKSLM